MALSRSYLSALGIEADKVDEIIRAHSETVSGLKEERDSYKEKAEKFGDIQKELDALKAEKVKSDEWKTKFEKEHDDFESYKKEVAGKEQSEKVKSAYKKLLAENNVGENHIDSILEVTKLDELKLDENGNLMDSDKLTDGIKERWAGFITETKKTGAKFENPPKNGGSKLTKEEILKEKDTAKRQALIAENIDLFE